MRRSPVLFHSHIIHEWVSSPGRFGLRLLLACKPQLKDLIMVVRILWPLLAALKYSDMLDRAAWYGGISTITVGLPSPDLEKKGVR
jgi:hypothetical protein